ncbi:MAG: hypothetical protein AAGB31_04085 [Bdellovibrio sp.]
MKKEKLIFLLITLFVISSAHGMGSYERCTPIEQIPDAIFEGTIGPTIVMSEEDSLDLILFLKSTKTSEIKSLNMIYQETDTPTWSNGPFVMTIDFTEGLYTLTKSTQKILTLSCKGAW